MEEIGFLLLTLVCELPIVGLSFPRPGRRRAMEVMFFANMVTHPLGWLLIAKQIPWIEVEIGVVLVEALVLACFFPAQRLRSFVVAVCANLVSALIGLLLFSL